MRPNANEFSMARYHTPRLFSLFFFIWCVTSPGAMAVDKPEIKATHSPKQPKSGEAVRVSVELRNSAKADDLVLQYQIVEPGAYIALSDPAYAKDWKELPLESDRAASGESRATFRATLPAEVQKN